MPFWSREGRTLTGRPRLRISILLVLVLVGGKVADLRPAGLFTCAFAADLLAAAHEDLQFGVTLAALGALVGWLVRRRARIEPWVWWALVTLEALACGYTVIACRVYRFLWLPLTYPMLAVGGGFGGLWSSVRHALSPGFIALLVLVPAGFVAAAKYPLHRSPRSRLIALVLSIALVILGLGLAHEGSLLAETAWASRADRAVTESPHLALARSFGADLGAASIPHGLDFEYGPKELADFARPFASPPHLTAKQPRGVILYVMESTGAEYLDLYGGNFQVTPRLSEIERGSVVFDHAYANLGRTEGALSTLLLSQYLPFTWRFFTRDHVRAEGTTLAELLQKQGFRTAFLSAGDLGYASQRLFVQNRGFDVVTDGERLGCETVFKWGVSDACEVDAILKEVDRDAGAPFFILAWTNQTHHPYGQPKDVPPRAFDHPVAPNPDFDFDAYLGALAEADRQLGLLFDGLAARGLKDDVLLAITGDHSEAFGLRHPALAHGWHLYDEEMRVPLLLHWPAGLPEPTRDSRIVSHLDLTPTLAQLLGLPQAPTWSGRSVFDTSRPERAYLFASTGPLMMGLRDASWKLSVTPGDGHRELYDLNADPGEQRNLADARPDVIAALGPKLAAWIASTRDRWKQGDMPLLPP